MEDQYSKAVFCPACRAPNFLGSEFCAQCKANLPPSVPLTPLPVAHNRSRYWRSKIVTTVIVVAVIALFAGAAVTFTQIYFTGIPHSSASLTSSSLKVSYWRMDLEPPPGEITFEAAISNKSGMNLKAASGRFVVFDEVLNKTAYSQPMDLPAPIGFNAVDHLGNDAFSDKYIVDENLLRTSENLLERFDLSVVVLSDDTRVTIP